MMRRVRTRNHETHVPKMRGNALNQKFRGFDVGLMPEVPHEQDVDWTSRIFRPGRKLDRIDPNGNSPDICAG